MRNTARQTRDNRTITVNFQHEATYVQLLSDGKAFGSVANLLFREFLGLQAIEFLIPGFQILPSKWKFATDPEISVIVSWIATYFCVIPLSSS
jgi:hypothetical protein